MYIYELIIICIYIYIYIYVIHRQICFVLLELFSVGRHVGRWKPGSKSIELTLDSVSDRSVNKHTTLAKGIIRSLCSNSSSSSSIVRLFTFLYPKFIIYNVHLHCTGS